MSIGVVATIKAKTGKEEDLESLLNHLVDETHQESGCLTYALHRSQADPATFIFVEKWASEKDLQSHLQSPHVAKALERKEELIDTLEIVPLVPIKRGNPQKGSY